MMDIHDISQNLTFKGERKSRDGSVCFIAVLFAGKKVRREVGGGRGVGTSAGVFARVSYQCVFHAP